MRRGINLRKKNKIMLKQINSKSIKLLFLLITVLLICLAIYFFFVQGFFIKKNIESDAMTFSSLNEDIPFSINKLLLFSSATATSSTINQALSLDISNYCDIGIYLNKINVENIKVSSLFIDNILISNPEIGTPCLYKKSISDFGKCSFDENNIVTDNLSFNIVDSNKDLNYSNYEVYDNVTTPIALGFYNKNIRTNFFTDNSNIFYNGKLLKDATIPATSLNCNISFRLNIITSTNEHYICNVNFDFPFEDENGSIYETGYITKEFNSNETSKFIRIK